METGGAGPHLRGRRRPGGRIARTLETTSPERVANMRAFALETLKLMNQQPVAEMPETSPRGARNARRQGAFERLRSKAPRRVGTSTALVAHQRRGVYSAPIETLASLAPQDEDLPEGVRATRSINRQWNGTNSDTLFP